MKLATPVKPPTSHSTGPGGPVTLPSKRSLNVCVFGAGPGTGNHGVAALSLSLLSGIARRVASPVITAFDNGEGIRPASAAVAGGELAYQLCGAVPTRRIYRRDSMWRIRASGWLGGLGSDAIKVIREADAVLDLTSGDSFTDLYSARRFRMVALEKMIALEQHRPLILLPQTIGPFRSASARRVAQRILRSAEAVWARDRQSFATLRELLGRSFDPSRHQCGVDLAFGLEAHEPVRPLPTQIASWLSKDAGETLIGFNVSGLLFNNSAAAASQYGLRADYPQAVTQFLQRILRETDANILLVPHVFGEPGHKEHDPDACAAVAMAIRGRHDHRVAVIPDGYDPCETKWIVSRTDWFCGARMHATIAALSSGVPAAAIAYSPKIQGVLETCGQGAYVADLRNMATDEIVDRLWHSWSDREDAGATLRERLPSVRRQVESQMDEIVARCTAPPCRPTRGHVPEGPARAMNFVRELSQRVTPLRRSINVLRDMNDRWIDRRWNVRTTACRGSLAHGSAGTSPRHDDAVHYEPIRYSVLLKYLRPLEPTARDVVFDIGSGLGRALHAFSRLGVGRCIGIELRADLAEIARENARRLRRRKCPIETRTADAATADYRGGTIYLFFNPFGAATLKAVLAGIEETLDADPRHIKIAYFTPRHENVLHECDWLRLVDRKSSLFHRIAATYWVHEV